MTSYLLIGGTNHGSRFQLVGGDRLLIVKHWPARMSGARRGSQFPPPGEDDFETYTARDLGPAVSVMGLEALSDADLADLMPAVPK